MLAIIKYDDCRFNAPLDLNAQQYKLLWSPEKESKTCGVCCTTFTGGCPGAYRLSDQTELCPMTFFASSSQTLIKSDVCDGNVNV